MHSKKAKLKLFLNAALALAAFGFIGVFGIFAYYAKDLPSPASISELKVAESTKIYDRTGKILLYDIHGEQKRTVIPIEETPAYIKYATIVAEDDSFYRHFGVDFKGIARAMISNIKRQGVVQGGSTITQQLIKNIYLTPERTIARKIRELILAIEMEIKYSKEDILSFYLNIVPYGSNAYGIEAASQTFFNKHAKELTIAEASLLASLPKAPTYYSPFGNNPDKLDKRQKYVLSRMLSLGYITEEQYEEAKTTKIKYNGDTTGIKAPHFVIRTIEYLEERYGKYKLKNSGFSVITTLDWELQEEAEKIVKKWAEINEERFGAKNAALIAIDPKTGQILAMVGSRDYFNQENDGNVNVTTRLRQPGSSFKPFAYAKAFEKGYTPDTVIFDVETNFGVQGTEEYIPQNYDESFRGPITFKEALAQSINVASVKVLYLAGVADTIKLAKSMGISSLNEPDRYGLSLVLGGGEVTLLDEASAYGVFSQEGIYNKPTGILEITDKDGATIEKFSSSGKKVMDAQIARLVTSVLSNNDYRAPLFGYNSRLNLGDINAAVKTGTTQEYRDAWTVGYTPDVVVGVWVGNNDNSKMNEGTGISAAAPIWNEFMKAIYSIKEYPVKQFTPPEPIETNKPILNGSLGGSITLQIDKLSGKRATEYTPPELIEERSYYEPHSLLYFVKKDNPQGDRPSNPDSDSQFQAWEEGIQEWISKEENSHLNFSTVPQEYDDIHTEENLPIVSIIRPTSNAVVKAGALVPLNFSTKNNFSIDKVEIFFDNQVVKIISNLSLNNQAFSTSFRVPVNIQKENPSTGSEQATHTIKVRVFDTVLNRGDDEVNVVVN